MQATFFQAVASVLTAGNNAIIEVQGLGEGQIKVIYTPCLGITPQNASTEVVNLRAAICKPLVVAGSADEVEAAFVNHIKQKAAVVSRGLSLLDEIERLGAAALESTKARATKITPVAADDDSDDEEGGDNDPDAGAIGDASPVVVDGVKLAEEAPKTMANF